MYDKSQTFQDEVETLSYPNFLRLNFYNNIFTKTGTSWELSQSL